MENFHVLSVEESLKKLSSSHDGLDENTAISSLEKYGKNEIDEGEKRTVLQMIAEQFKDIMIIILIIAAVISGVLGEVTDAIIILLVVLINAIMGVAQESKAEKALDALKQLSKPYVKVRRGGNVSTIKTELVVPGDIVLLEAGDFVPADMRLTKNASLKIDEAALTGESVPVEKDIETLESEDLVIGDRVNMAYSGSVVVYGRGEGVVVSTGMQTEVGKIASNISNAEASITPLQMKLAEMTKILTIVIVIVCILMFAIGIFNQRPAFEMLLTAVSLAVAALPEGLPAVITIILALGVQRMSKQNAIVRKLSAVETLGSTEIICSDKTGTLTQNKMTVKRAVIGLKNTTAEEIDVNAVNTEKFLRAMSLCNDTKVNHEGEKEVYVGDPTETALVDFASHSKLSGMSKEELDGRWIRVAEVPFDSDRKLMSTIHKVDNGFESYTKGAPDVLLSACTRILKEDGSIADISSSDLEYIKDQNSQMARTAMRVLAVAFKPIESDGNAPSYDPKSLEQDMVYIGLVGMVDPPRPEAKLAVEKCKKSGIRAIMITGDHGDTAAAIAKELGILDDESQLITGSELNKLSDEEFDRRVSDFSVYARVSPEHKVKIVDAWKRKGKIVAMTGDGVNDAPALKHSDIGIGMGITGTDVSKSVSNIVLADDNFATIVVAVEEGRKVYSNMRKTIQFLLSCNLGEVLTLFIATMLNWQILLPIHILWVNLITDTFPALALGVDTPEKGLMDQKPRSANSSFFSDGVGVSIVIQGITKGLIVLGAYWYTTVNYIPQLGEAEGHQLAMTVAFVTLCVVQLFHVFNVRSVKESMFKAKIFDNIPLMYAVVGTFVLQVIIIQVPFLSAIFKVHPLTFIQWLEVVAISATVIPVTEAFKFIVRKLEASK